MAKKKIKFAIMNMLIKGTPKSIQEALLTINPDTYELKKNNI